MMEDDDTADRAHSLVTVCYSNNTLGFSCYEEISNTIFCFTAPVPADELEDSLTNLKARLMPTIFLLHPRLLCNKFFMDMLLASVAGAPDYYRYKVLKSSTWNDRTCNQLIHKSLSIRSAGSNTHLSNCQQVASAVDIDSEHCRQTLGALLAYMQESIFKLDAGSITVANLKMYAQEAFVQVDQKSLNALQIFAEEVHPNVMKGKGRSKEGFSLFGLFDRTNSLPGRFRLRDWMSRPFCSKEKILQRQKGVALVSRPCNRDFVVGICALLKHFHNLPRLLLRVKKVEAGCGDWCDILTSLMTAQKLLDHVAAFASHPTTDPTEAEYVRDLFVQLCVAEVHRLSQALQSALDVQETRAEGRVVFREGYDAPLDQMRQVFHHLETHLVQAAHRVLEIVPLLQVALRLLPCGLSCQLHRACYL
jgi:DNA mismatch repair ATPase MutS